MIDEDTMLDELLIGEEYSENQFNDIRNCWLSLNADQRLVVYMLICSGYSEDIFDAFDIAVGNGYVLYSEYCKTPADVAREEWELDYSDFVFDYAYKHGFLYNGEPLNYHEEILEVGCERLVINWDDVGEWKEWHQILIYSDEAGRWLEVYEK